MSTTFLKTFISIFMIMGPFSVIPIFVSLTENYSRQQTKRIAKKAVTTAAVILIFSATIGDYVFALFGISVHSFRIAGGILMLLMGVHMLYAQKSPTKTSPQELDEAKEKDDISIFPLATPLIAGPGAISTAILFTAGNDKWKSWTTVAIAILISSAIFYLLLRQSRFLYGFLGQTGVNILTRLMGLILSAIAVEYIMMGLKATLFS